jgi:diaminopimelate decarboxylase
LIKFTPLLKDTINDFINERDCILNFSRAFKEPFHILFPQNMNLNIQGFYDVFKRNQIRGKIFYAHKVNKSKALVAQAESQNIGIDCATENELIRALSLGFNGERIELTGPKTEKLIFLGLKHNCIFNIDNIPELQIVSDYIHKLKIKNKIKILLRFGEFSCDYIKMTSKNSKFGIPKQDLSKALKILGCHRNHMELIGFSFHLDTIEIKEKIIAIENCLEFFEEARKLNFDPHVLNIGGGFKVNYLADESQWNEGISAIKESVLGIRESFTWGNLAFGLRNEEGTLRGNLNVYNYFDKVTGPKYLDHLLKTPLPAFDHVPLGVFLSDNMIDLMIEPGRSLLDQVGISVAKITQMKESPKGDLMAVLNLRRMDIAFGDQEIFVDPVILEMGTSDVERIQPEEPPSSALKGFYLSGSLCLESDLCIC